MIFQNQKQRSEFSTEIKKAFSAKGRNFEQKKRAVAQKCSKLSNEELQKFLSNEPGEVASMLSGILRRHGRIYGFTVHNNHINRDGKNIATFSLVPTDQPPVL